MRVILGRVFYVALTLAALSLTHSVMAQPFVYIPNSGDSTVSVIDMATQTVVSTITVGLFPHAVAVNETGTRAYVANSGGESVSVIDTATNTVIATITIPRRDAPWSLVVHPDGSHVYVATNERGGKVYVIDTATNTVTDTIDVGTNPWDIAIDPTGKYLFVTNSEEDTLSVIDTDTNTVVQTVATGDLPLGVEVHPSGLGVFVANAFDNTISLFELADTSNPSPANLARGPLAGMQPIINIEARFLTVGNFPTDIGISWPGDRLFVPNCNDGNVGLFGISGPPFFKSNLIRNINSGGCSESGFWVRATGTSVILPLFSQGEVALADVDVGNNVYQVIEVGPNPTAWGGEKSTPILVNPITDPPSITPPNPQPQGMAQRDTLTGSGKVISTPYLPRHADSPPLPRLLAANGGSVQLRFFYRAGYGTPEYNTNPWVNFRDFDTSNEAIVEFPAEDNYVVVVHAVNDPTNIPAAVPIIGMSVNTGAGSEDVQITQITANLPGGTPRAGDYVTFIVKTTGPATMQYRFYYKAGYGTPAYNTNPWVLAQDFGPNNAATFKFPSADNYVVVVHVVPDPNNIPAAIPIIGMNVVVVED